MDESERDSILRDLANSSRAFTAADATRGYGDSLDSQGLLAAVAGDRRFIVTRVVGTEDVLLLPTKRLWRWFVGLGTRVARDRSATVTEQQLARAFSETFMERGIGSQLPAEVLENGLVLGLIAGAHDRNRLVFPIGSILSRLAPRTVRLAETAILELADPALRSTRLLVDADGWARRVLSHFSERVAGVVEAREGLFGRRTSTLDAVGQRLRVTRERVRQIERQFWERFIPEARSPDLVGDALTGLLLETMRVRGRLLHPVTARSLLFLARCLALPAARVPHSAHCLLTASESELWDMVERDLVTDAILQPDREQTTVGTSTAWVPATDMKVIRDATLKYQRKRLRQLHVVRLALSRIGRPAHYSEITDMCEQVFPEKNMSERAVQAVLNRQKAGIVWVGVHGTYALRDWGYERPNLSLFETVGRIVRERFEETGQPVPLGVVVAEFGKYRRLVKHTSLVMALVYAPTVRDVGGHRFVPCDETDERIPDRSTEAVDRALKALEALTETPGSC